MGALCFGMSMGLGPKLDLDAAAAENQAFMTTRTNEREEMVRNLESQNKLLEAEIEGSEGPPCQTIRPQAAVRVPAEGSQQGRRANENPEGESGHIS
ncbi:hypothetical protein GBF38_005923 [Nibea albiflora]|uniref:Uncharacterized protein n=1 Tax=Nibea albiflora TaxID=240163 RepID=A0ACB7FAJ4_NIBAL|nr:hypothetical protein GBF38_005923 [Nibea albiflora]